MLPNGSILIVGGVGAAGQIISVAEVFDPEGQVFKDLPPTGLTRRAYHTATLLTDGRVLVAGGKSESGDTQGTIEIWDFLTNSSMNLPSGLLVPRSKHTATLLPDGSVLFWGGENRFGDPLNYGEVFDPLTETERIETSSALLSPGTQAPQLEASIPQDGARNVPVNAFIALRFSKRLSVATVNARTVSLSGPSDSVLTHVVPAEGGMLAFLTPQAVLLSGTTYVLSLSGLTDGTSAMDDTFLSFTTAGTTSGESGVLSGSGDSSESMGSSQALNSPFLKLPPLQAPIGVTALAGQTLRLNGLPLEGVTIRIDDKATRTNGTGRFLLEGITAGHHVMIVDATSPNGHRDNHGIYTIGVDVTGKVTNVLPYTIWLPVVDMSQATHFPSPTTHEVVATTPLIPGLEVHIPPNDVFRDVYGNVVTSVTITPIPMGQMPFPGPPGVMSPISFTLQLSGTTEEPVNGGPGPGIRTIFPNAFGLPPGSRVNIYSYNPKTALGWFIVGQGAVTANGKQIVPDPGVLTHRFACAALANPNTEPAVKPPLNGARDGEPVDLSTGLFIHTKTDLFLNDVFPIEFTRTYRQSDSLSRSFGIGTQDNYDVYLVGNPVGAGIYNSIDLVMPDGAVVNYPRVSINTGGVLATFQHNSTPTNFFGSTLTYPGGNEFDLTLKNGTKYVFDFTGKLVVVQDRYGNRITISRTTDSSEKITQITSPNGRWVQLSYDSLNRITGAVDNIGRTVSYSYDFSGRLSAVTDVNGGQTTYSYDSNNNMLTIRDARFITYLTNQYDANNRVVKQTTGTGGVFQYAYTTDLNNKVTQTNVTDPRGFVRQVTFNSSGYRLTDTRAQGKPEQQTYTFTRQAGSNFITTYADPLTRQTSYSYDSMGNVTSVTLLAGTSNAVTTSLTYEPKFNQVTSIADPLAHIFNFSYDTSGNLISIADPLNNQTALTYNTSGQILTVADSLNNKTQFVYDSGDLVSVADPLVRTTTFANDGVGRPIAITNALGQTMRYTYNSFDQVVTVTDSLGGITSASYDADANLLSVTDMVNHITKYLYDNMGHFASRTDPLGNIESFQYDASANVSQFTDRRGKVTTFSYDGLNRRTFAGYGTQAGPTYESTVSFAYDAGNHMTQVVDSITGTITRTYDGLDRLTQEATPQGTVNYAYDAVGRRTSVTIAGQPVVNYFYDNGNRLTQMTQGTSTISFSYDVTNRRTSLTLPNGIVANYSYDAASQLSAITYQLGSTTVGNLSYAYDLASRVASIAGTFARTNLPLAITATAYNADDQLTQWATASLFYDANGNLTSDGTNSYSWDARNRLVSINSGATASFQYDAFFRRVSKTIAGTATSFLYDSFNPVEEISGGTPTANILAGDLDESFQRSDVAGARSFLRDGLGSTVALTDSSGAMQVQYTFDPFGSTSSTGMSANTQEFTGRENDTTGLYEFRARYYSTSLDRFISEDPAGLIGGINPYAYVSDSPTNSVDPFGLLALCWRPVRVLGLGRLGACHGFLVLSDGTTLGGYKFGLNLFPEKNYWDDDILHNPKAGTTCKKVPASKCDEDRVRKAFEKLRQEFLDSPDPPAYGVSGVSTSVAQTVLDDAGLPYSFPKCAWFSKVRAIPVPIYPVSP